MKKVILIVLMVVNLSANERLCDKYYDKVGENSELAQMAIKRVDYSDALYFSKEVVRNAEKYIVKCDKIYSDIDSMIKVRDSYLNLIQVIKGER